MNRIFFSFLVAIALTSCGSGAPTNKTVTDSTVLTAQHINGEQFAQKVYNYKSNVDATKFLGSKPTIVDFYADWCGPCRQLSPLLDELLNEYDGKFDLYKVDTDKEQSLAVDFGIEALPTLLFIPLSGEPVFVKGYQSKDELKTYVKDILKID